MKKLIAILLLLSLMIPASIAESEVSTDLTVIRINEFMASNGDTIEDKNGEDSDWIELYNTSDKDVNLKGLCLSDGKKTLDKFVFPEVIIPAHGYLVVFCTDEEEIIDGEIHVAFKLSSDGEKVVLSFGGEILDIVSFDAQEKDVSYGRVDEKNWAFCHTPTPGAETAGLEGTSNHARCDTGRHGDPSSHSAVSPEGASRSFQE